MKQEEDSVETEKSDAVSFKEATKVAESEAEQRDEAAVLKEAPLDETTVETKRIGSKSDQEAEQTNQAFDDGLIYGVEEPRKKPNMVFDEGLIYGVNIFEEARETLLDDDYDSGLITDDAEENFRATTTRENILVQSRQKKGSKRTKSAKIQCVQRASEDEYDSGLITDEADENYRIIYTDKEVQTEVVELSEEEGTEQEGQSRVEAVVGDATEQNPVTAVKVADTTDDNTTDQAIPTGQQMEVKDDSESSTSMISRVSTPTPTPRTKSVSVMKVSQQVDESEYENTTADEKPVIPVRRKLDTAFKKLERVSFVEKVNIRRSTVSLAEKRDPSPDEASDSYDADYESYDNEDDYVDRYEPAEISLADTIICVGFGYALIYT